KGRWSSSTSAPPRATTSPRSSTSTSRKAGDPFPRVEARGTTDMSPSRRWIISILALAGLAAAGTAVVRHRSAKDDGGLRTEVVGRGAVAATVTSTGTISAVHTVQVGSQVSGIVSSLSVDYNSPVTKGQLLATLDPTPLQAQV